MSITGAINFFSMQEVDLHKALTDLLAWTEAKDRPPQHRPYALWRTIGPDRTWELSKAAAHGDYDPQRIFQKESFYERELARFAMHLKPGTHLSIDLSAPPKGHRIGEAIERIPMQVRDTFAPGDIILNLGYFDIIDGSSEVEEEEGQLIARPFTAVSLFGYGCPKDWAKMRELTPQLPEIVAVRNELSAILGPIHMAMLWDV